MSDPEYDFVVIGGGSAGYAGAATAVRHGLKTAVVEGGKEMGGLCILRGCMPSKALLESAQRAEAIRDAGEFGLRAEYLGAEPAKIRARKRRIIGEFADYRTQQLQSGRFALIRGMASFVDPHTIEVESEGGARRRVRSRAFLIATGSRVQWVEIPGLRETGFWTSDDFLDADCVPASVVVLGGGAIALEAASFYAGMGSKVTVIQRGAQVLKETDADVAQAVTEGLQHRGIAVFLGTSLVRAERAGEMKRVVFRHAGEEQFAEGEEIIYALGREPLVHGLNLGAAGVQIERGRIATDAMQQTTAPHIFAAGDVAGRHEVVHIAIQQAEIATCNAARSLGQLQSSVESIDYRLQLFAVFTHPQVASVGLTEKEARAAGVDILVAKYPFADHGKSILRGELDGFVKLIADRAKRRILGGSCVGPEAAELIHEIVVAMHFNATAGELAKVPHYHPTLSEIWTYPAEELAFA